MTAPRLAARQLTDEQRRIVDWGEGPAVVIAGAGTRQTRVIVERVRWHLDTKGPGARDANGHPISAEPVTRDRPFDRPLSPEQILVLAYNVNAAHELEERHNRPVGASRLHDRARSRRQSCRS